MKVLHDRVLLKKIETENKSAGGIVLAGEVEPHFEATVVLVGTGRQVKDGPPIPPTVKEGDRVMYNPAACVDVKVNGESMLVIKELEIYAILSDD
jgi:chaperonin GroES